MQSEWQFLFLCSLAATLCAMQQAHAMNQDNSKFQPGHIVLESNERQNCAPIVDAIYAKVFEPAQDSNPLTHEQIHDMIDEAYGLMTSPAHRYVSQNSRTPQLVYKQLELFHEMADEHLLENLREVDCIRSKLIRFKVLEKKFENHINLRSYFSHYNARKFEKCAKILVQKFSLTQSHSHAASSQGYVIEREHLGQVSKMVAARRKELINEQLYPIDEPEEEEEESLRNTSFIIMKYLSENLHLDITKPLNRPMVEQLNLMGQMEDDVFLLECNFLTQLHAADYLQYQLFVHYYRTELWPLFWDQDLQVAELIEQLRICHQLAHANTHIYLLGRYDLDSLINRLDDTTDGTNSPEEMRDLLEIVLFAAQAEVYLGYDYAPMASYYLDLFVPSQIDRQKCQATYFRLLKQKIDWHSDNPNIINYLRHFGVIQVLKCLHRFGSQLRRATSSLDETQRAQLNTLHEVFNYIAQHNEPPLRLYYDPIPNYIVRFASEKLFDLLGYNLFTLSDNELIQKLPQTQFQVEILFETCRLFINQLANLADLFRLFIIVDSEAENHINSEIAKRMSQYNICKTLISLQLSEDQLNNLNLNAD